LPEFIVHLNRWNSLRADTSWLDIATAREAFAKAIERHDTGRFRNVTISDDSKSYSIVAFALAMAHLEIAKTGDAGDVTAEAPARDA